VVAQRTGGDGDDARAHEGYNDDDDGGLVLGGTKPSALRAKRTQPTERAGKTE